MDNVKYLKRQSITKKKKIVLFLAFTLLFFSFANFSLAKCENDNDCQIVSKESQRTIRCIDTDNDGEKECVRSLEIVYPQIGSKFVPKTVASGLPDYIKYIFNFAVSIIGLIIFGALIYNGALYLTSVGNPQKMGNAKDGIISAFLGGILLISSVLIFHTINPQLTIMKLPKIKPLEQVEQAGIYICNYKVPASEKLGDTIKNYTLEEHQAELTEEEIKKQGEAAEKLKKIIWNSKTKICPRANFSGPLQNFEMTKDKTIFAIPSIKITSGKRQAIYEYGIILHEKEDFGGNCYLVNQKESNIYQQIKDFSAKDLSFSARSITIFQKPSSEPKGNGVTLYECFDYNKEGQCKEEDKSPLSKIFNPEAEDFKKFNDLGKLKKNTRSISFSPKNSYLALLFEKESFKGQCQVIPESRTDLADLPLGCCNKKIIKKRRFWFDKKTCYPCLNSMIVVKGHRL